MEAWKGLPPRAASSRKSLASAGSAEMETSTVVPPRSRGLLPVAAGAAALPGALLAHPRADRLAAHALRGVEPAVQGRAQLGRGGEARVRVVAHGLLADAHQLLGRVGGGLADAGIAALDPVGHHRALDGAGGEPPLGERLP